MVEGQCRGCSRAVWSEVVLLIRHGKEERLAYSLSDLGLGHVHARVHAHALLHGCTRFISTLESVSSTRFLTKPLEWDRYAHHLLAAFH